MSVVAVLKGEFETFLVHRPKVRFASATCPPASRLARVSGEKPMGCSQPPRVSESETVTVLLGVSVAITRTGM